MRLNGIAPGVMAEEARRAGALLIHYSTDHVYDGEQERPYIEDDPAHPVNAYGRSKLAGERAIHAVGGRHLILRTSWAYSDRRENFVLAILRLAREKRQLRVVDDQSGSPSWVRALADATAELLGKSRIAAATGVYHLSAEGHASRYEFARAIIRHASELAGAAGRWADIERIPSS